MASFGERYRAGAGNVGAATVIDSRNNCETISDNTALLQIIKTCVVNLAMKQNSSLRQPPNSQNALMLNARASASAEGQLLLR